MPLKRIISRIGSLGVRANFKPWERYLTRKLNFFALLCMLTDVLSLIVYFIIGDLHFFKELIAILLAFPLVFIFNIRLNYIYALYLFYAIATGIVLTFLFEMGYQSEIFLYFFPLTISLLTMLNQKEKAIHVRILFIMLFALVAITLVGYRYGWLQGSLSPDELKNVRIINIFFSSFITLSFSIILSKQTSIKENELLNLVKEKETLLAEVHHRVKNNMAIVSGLLSLKQETCQTDEARDVLEDCKNRIYSMALIHKNLYGNKTLKEINFEDYLSELTRELTSTYSETNKIKLVLDAEGSNLYIDTAIPCGFILNELLTNSLKHALAKDRTLIIHIKMKITEKKVKLFYSDNGPGLSRHKASSETSLGMVIIDLLSQQLEASYNFKNDNGLVFEMGFNLN